MSINFIPPNTGGGGGGVSQFIQLSDVDWNTAQSGDIPTWDGQKLEPGQAVDVSGKVDSVSAPTSAPADPLISYDHNYALGVNDPDIMEFKVQGARKSWLNEWGALRFISPYGWGDAGVRGIRQNSDGINNGQYMELEDRRSGAPATILHGRRWSDGALIRWDLEMADTLLLEDGDDLPDDVPPGTFVVWYDPDDEL